MNTGSDFPLAVVASACAGAAALRDRLALHGLDTATMAGLVHTSPMTLARATKTGATPRGVLIGLAVLAEVMDRLARHGVGASDLSRTGGTAAAMDAVGAESAAAAEMVGRLHQLSVAPPSHVQLSFDAADRAAA